MRDPYADLKSRVDAIVSSFAASMKSRLGVVLRTGSNSNDAFIVRAYAATPPGASMELAATIDFRRKQNAMTIDCDLCWEDGRIAAEGPKLEISFATPNWHTLVDEALSLVAPFLDESADALAKATASRE